MFKAPANEIVRGAVDFASTSTKSCNRHSTPAGSMPSSSISGTAAFEFGVRAQYPRTRSGKYVSVRRLFIFLERSIYEGTQWVVFKPNDDRLWCA